MDKVGGEIIHQVSVILPFCATPFSIQPSHWLTTVVGLGLGCLMTPGLSKDICVMYDHTFLNIKPHTNRAVSLVIAYDHFNILQGFVWVCIG